MSDVRDLVFGPCQTCLRPICQCPTKHAPPPDTQTMAREMVLKIADKVFQHYPFKHELNYWLAHDAAQRETIRRLEVELKKWRDSFAGHVYVKNEEWSAKCEEVRSLQARLTASEAKLKWTTVRPTVAGWYWWRTTNVPATIIELREMGNVVIVPMKTGEWQGPLTPGEA